MAGAAGAWKRPDVASDGTQDSAEGPKGASEKLSGQWRGGVFEMRLFS